MSEHPRRSARNRNATKPEITTSTSSLMTTTTSSRKKRLIVDDDVTSSTTKNGTFPDVIKSIGKSKSLSCKTENLEDDYNVANATKRRAPERPTAEECAFAVRELGKLHPSVLEKTTEIRNRTQAYIKMPTKTEHGRDSSTTTNSNTNIKADPVLSSCGDQQNLLDGVISTMLSQNTTAANSTRAFANLKRDFPDWNQVAKLPSPTKLEPSIRCAGLANSRADRIWNLCKTLMEEQGEASLEYLRGKSNDDIQKDLMRFKGLGKKTISCVLLFTLGRSEFPVDTHVHRISKQYKWIPSHYSRDDAYDYLNEVVPNGLKMDLHCLLVQHGRECHRCAARGKPQFPPKDGSKLNCPMIHLNNIANSKGIPLPVKTEFVADVKKEPNA